MDRKPLNTANGRQMKFLLASLATAASLGLVTTHVGARADDAQKYYGDVNSYATCWLHMMQQFRLAKEVTGIDATREDIIKAICNKATGLVVDGLNWPTAMQTAVRQVSREVMSR